MRKIFLVIILFLVFSKVVLVQFGNCIVLEMWIYVDSVIGNIIIMLIDMMKNDCFFYQIDFMWMVDGKYLLFRFFSCGNDKEVESMFFNGEKCKWIFIQIYFIEMVIGKII